MRPNKVRVLQVLWSLDMGGIETFISAAVRHLDSSRFDVDFVVHVDKKGSCEPLLEASGFRVLRCPDPYSGVVEHARRFLSLLSSGAYDVVHSHFDPVGYPLRLAHYAGVPVRIAHAHTSLGELKSLTPGWRRLLLPAANSWLRKHATVGIAVSRKTAELWFGRSWESENRWRVLHCGIDIAPFRKPVDPRQVRRELGVADNVLMLGHVGRFHPVKNHHFLIEVVAAAGAKRPIALLLVGEGPSREAIVAQLRARGLESVSILTSARADEVPSLLAAMDVLVFPSHLEGLPLALLEAQARGLPCYVSDVITEEVDVIPDTIFRLSLSAGPEKWADAIVQREPLAHRNEELACQRLEESSFNIQHSSARLGELYVSELLSSNRVRRGSDFWVRNLAPYWSFSG